jgi:hypothetical protein
MLRQSSKKFFGFVLIVFLTAVFAAYFIDFANANFQSPYYSPKITMQSPTDGGVYTTSLVALKISISAGYGKYVASGLQTTVKLDGIKIQEGSNTIDALMQNLNNGLHSIEVYAFADYGASTGGPGYDNTIKISFTVNTGVGPVVTFSSGTEFGSDGAILVNLNDGDSSVLYRLDDKINVTVQKTEMTKNLGVFQFNVNFTGLSSGSHSLVVFATDRLGNSAKQTLSFNVGGAAQETTPTQTPQGSQMLPALTLGSIIIVAIVVVAVAAIFVGIFVFRKKPKKQAE